VAESREVGDMPGHAGLLAEPAARRSRPGTGEDAILLIAAILLECIPDCRGPARPAGPRHEDAPEGHVLHYSILRPRAHSDDFPVSGNDQATAPEQRRYELHLLRTIALRPD
jgi:hypothetical protein